MTYRRDIEPLLVYLWGYGLLFLFGCALLYVIASGIAALFGMDWHLCGVDYNGTPGGEPFCFTSAGLTRG